MKAKSKLLKYAITLTIIAMILVLESFVSKHIFLSAEEENAAEDDVGGDEIWQETDENEQEDDTETEEEMDIEQEETEAEEPPEEAPQEDILADSAAFAAPAEMSGALAAYNVIYKNAGTFAELNEILLGLDSDDNVLTYIRLTSNITATKSIGGTTAAAGAADGNFVIDGGGLTLNMANYCIYLQNNHNLYVYDITIEQSLTKASDAGTAGLFCIGIGSTSQWNAEFHNLSFYGSALLGSNLSSGKNYAQRFEQVSFSGMTGMYVSGYWARNAVILARNISIADMFQMTGTASENTAYDDAMLKPYFVSANTNNDNSNYTTEGSSRNDSSAGCFYIGEGADVQLIRAPARSSHAESTAYYQSMIRNYAEYEFDRESSFMAKAGTNRASDINGATTTAVIKSADASKFYIGEGAAVNIETDRVSAVSNNYGFIGLFLGKKEHLDFTVEAGAELSVTSKGVALIASLSSRSSAPIAIMNTGSSTTKIYGTMEVKSNTGSSWYYEYLTALSKEQRFAVQGAEAAVRIQADALYSPGTEEYAAFHAYGMYDVFIEVTEGASMAVTSNGYRGMSLAAAGRGNAKSIYVDGKGSRLDISGVMWGIAAEADTNLDISASNEGVLKISSEGDVGEKLGITGGTPCALYAVGNTAISADSGADITFFHRGGSYSAIFQDGSRPTLKIDVTNNASINVESYSSGTNIAARRAAVTVQGSSTENYIKVSDDGTFSVRSHNPEIHTSSDTSQHLYAMGAINMGGSGNGGGTIDVCDGGNFYAVSNSPSPTIYMAKGTITFSNPGEFEIRNDSDSDTLTSTPNNLNKAPYSGVSDWSTVGQAIYIGAGTLRSSTSGTGLDATVFFEKVDISVWAVGKHHEDYCGGGYADQAIDTAWKGTTISASIGGRVTASNEGRIVNATTNVLNYWTTVPTRTDPLTGYSYTKQFALAAYGRILGSGQEADPGRSTNLLLSKEASKEEITLDEQFTYTITVGNTWLENVAGGTGDDGGLKENNTVWKDVVLIDRLDYRLDYVGCNDAGVKVEKAAGVDDQQRPITILEITIDQVKASEEFRVNLIVKPNDNAEVGHILENEAGIENMEDLISSNRVKKPLIIGPDGSICKVSNAENGEAKINSEFTYTITAENNGTALWKDVVITDTLPEELNYVTYTSSDNPQVTADPSGKTVKISFGDIPSGGKKELVITVKVNTSAVIGSKVFNRIYTDDGLEEKDEGTLITGTGSITVEKFGKNDQPLAGAVFTIEKYNSELNGGSWEYIRWDETQKKWMPATGEPYTQTTAINGNTAATVFEELELGEYRITEVDAPDGYSTLREPFTGTIPTSNSSGQPVYDITFTVYDDSILELPLTGNGPTAKDIILIGLLICITANVIFMYKQIYEAEKQIKKTARERKNENKKQSI